MIPPSQSTARPSAKSQALEGVLTMRGSCLRLCLTGLGAAAAATFASPAAAQPAPTDVETLIGASLSPDTGLTLARAQIGDRDLLGAAGTLERVLLAHPEAVPPRLLYVSLLCRLDDREGAEVELRTLDGYAIGEADWAEVANACGDIARPAPRRGKRR
jgi:hypothetical protein